MTTLEYLVRKLRREGGKVEKDETMWWSPIKMMDKLASSWSGYYFCYTSFLWLAVRCCCFCLLLFSIFECLLTPAVSRLWCVGFLFWGAEKLSRECPLKKRPLRCLCFGHMGSFSSNLARNLKFYQVIFRNMVFRSFLFIEFIVKTLSFLFYALT